MAIDRDAIIKDVYLGAGEKAKTLIPPTMWSYDDKIADYPYDPEKAKAMLAAAGVTDAARHRPLVPAGARPYNPNGKRIGEMMQADLAKIGVNAKLVTFEWGEYRKRMQNAEDMTGQMGWTGDNGDPDNFFFLLGCPDGKPGQNNIPKWCNAEFNDLLVKARTIADQGRARQALLAHAGNRTRRRAVAAGRAFDRVRGDARQRRRATSRARSARTRSKASTSSKAGPGSAASTAGPDASRTPPCSIISFAASR